MEITQLIKKIAWQVKQKMHFLLSNGSSTQNTSIVQVVFRIPPDFRSQKYSSDPIG